MTKPIGPICNLDCKYCFYLEKEALYAAGKAASPASTTSAPGAEHRSNPTVGQTGLLLALREGVRPQGRPDRIWEPFYQVDSTTRRQHEGIGLGLATCRRIVDRMDGRIEVESSLGHGTKFSFEVPIQTTTATRENETGKKNQTEPAYPRHRMFSTLRSPQIGSLSGLTR